MIFVWVVFGNEVSFVLFTSISVALGFVKKISYERSKSNSEIWGKKQTLQDKYGSLCKQIDTQFLCCLVFLFPVFVFTVLLEILRWNGLFAFAIEITQRTHNFLSFFYYVK